MAVFTDSNCIDSQGLHNRAYCHDLLATMLRYLLLGGTMKRSILQNAKCALVDTNPQWVLHDSISFGSIVEAPPPPPPPPPQTSDGQQGERLIRGRVAHKPGQEEPDNPNDVRS